MTGVKKYSIGQKVFLKRLTLKLLLLRNTLDLKINVAYFFQHLLSRISSKNLRSDQEGKKFARTLSKKGVVNLGVSEISELAQWADRYFGEHRPGSGERKIERGAADEVVSLVFKVLEEKLEAVLNAYYRSHFQFYWGTIVRNETMDVVDAGISWDFHLDDNPREVMKIFIYLNDVYEKNAAFRALDYRTSRELFKKGFISCSKELRIESQSLISAEIVKKLLIQEGKAGTVLIFDNNLIHRGTPPEQGYRDVVMLEVYPSSRRMDLDSLRKAFAIPITRDYPLSPFLNDSMA